MAGITRTIELLLCDKCLLMGKDKKAVETVDIRFLGDKERSLDLCAQHANVLRRLFSKDPIRSRGGSRSASLPDPVDCPICGESQRNRYTLGQHTKNTHSEWSSRITELRQTIRNAIDREGNQVDRGRAAERELTSLLAEAKTAWRQDHNATYPLDAPERVHV